MRAITIPKPGGPDALVLSDCPWPECGPDEVRIAVAATAVNRADILQRRGLYPPPPGASEVPGLECAGTVAEVGKNVRAFAPGDRVMALLAGGGYAEETCVHHGSLMPVPERLSLDEAGAVPEVFLTAFLNIFLLGELAAGGSVLVHGGSGGVGTAAIQLVRTAGCRIIVTAGSEERCQRCRDLGAHAAINYRDGPFAERVREATDGRGVDVVLDAIGAPYLAQNLDVLVPGGQLILIGLMGGVRTELNLPQVLTRRLGIRGSTLRARPVEEKARIVAAFRERFWPRLADGAIRPVIDRVLPLAAAAEAHRAVEEGAHFGKVVLHVSG